MNKKQKKVLTRIIIAAVLMIAFSFLPVEDYTAFVLFLIPYLVIGYDILIKAGKGIKNHQVFDENFLMAVATVGAIALGDYREGVAVMLFYQIGELFQSYAVGKSRRNISDLMDIRPDYANIERDGEIEEVDPDEVEIGSIIVVKPGEKVPIDGVIIEGTTTLNTSALTGESVPRDASEGDEVISGCINMTGVLRIKTTKEFGESTVSKILDMVENASSRKSRSENFMSKFAKYYTPAVCYGALALAVLPPIVRMLCMGFSPEGGDWIMRALTFLVISCPCALVISIPLSFFAGIGGASNAGVLVKGSNYLETLAGTKYVVFDKTGTLTNSCPTVEKVLSFGEYTSDEILKISACLEEHFPHSVAKAIVKSAKAKQLDHEEEHAEVEYVVAHGIATMLHGKRAIIGSEHFVLEDENIPITDEQKSVIENECEGFSVIYLAIGGVLSGVICISDPPRSEAHEAIQLLRESGIDNIIMLTGDHEGAAKRTADMLGIDNFRAQVLPEDKATIIEELKNEGRTVIMVGDGINDSPALALSDVSIAMKDSADLAREVADVTLLSGDLRDLALLRKLSSSLFRRIKRNYTFIMAFNSLLILLGLKGTITPSASSLLHNSSTMLISANSMRPLLKDKN